MVEAVIGAFIAGLLGGYVCWLIWLRAKSYPQDALPPPSDSVLPPCTIVFIFRNEADNLPNLLNSLQANQEHYPCPILAVDDGSTDASAQLIKVAQEGGLPITYYLHTGQAGKRHALAQALPLVATPHILQIDADCTPPPLWSLSVAQSLAATQPDILILPLSFLSKQLAPRWLSILNAEFATVMAVTAGMARAGKPVMCNGANLAYKTILWQDAASQILAQPHLGGDDMFLLDYALTQNRKVAYCDAPQVWITTEAPLTLSAFFRQRRRWAAKWEGYSSPWPVGVAAVTLLGQLGFVTASSMIGSLPWLAVLVGGKVVLEGLIIRRQLQKARLRFGLFPLVFWQIFYVPYIFAVAIASLQKPKPTTWRP